MWSDRPARGACVIQELPTGMVYEMDVWLAPREYTQLAGVPVRAPHGYLLEPWVRVTSMGGEWLLSAGAEVVTDEEDMA